MFNPFYYKLAISNIKRNKEIFFPYISTWIITIMMYYILMAITTSDELSNIGGGDSMKVILNFGAIVVAFFAIIFLFYTNSFIVKRRRKEISLYNILGLDKKHIGFVLFNETVIIAIGSLIIGIFAGVLFSRLTFLLLLKLLNQTIPFSFNISLPAVIITTILFLFIFIVILIFNITQIMINNPINLMKESKAGEKEPKVKILMTIFGIVTLGSGYAISLLIDNPIQAIGVFFIAVILVMIGTYALFTSGSIAILKTLRQNKKYYYQSKHFTVISGMLYRMKQNSVGLANICILSTMVLVTLSTTVSLYIGKEQSISVQYPHDVTLTTSSQSDTYNTDLLNEISTLAKNSNVELTGLIDYDYFSFGAVLKDGVFYNQDSVDNLDNFCILTFIPLDEYNKLNNRNVSLASGEIIVYTSDLNYQAEKVTFADHEFSVKEIVNEINVGEKENAYIGSTIKMFYFVVNDKSSIVNLYNEINSENQIQNTDYTIMFNVSGSETNQSTFYSKLNAVGDNNTFLRSHEGVRESFYSLYGGLLFIGVFLGLLFLMATASIIYYKQISEGYDDKERYRILKNVGMSNDEIHKTVSFQIKLVFFLPLIVAIIHIAFAFKIITKMLLLFGLVNTGLLILCTIGTIAVFTLVYMIIYALTAKTYYRIIG